MKICVIGTGYVGLVTGTCFSQLGHEVICVDKDKKRIISLRKGVVPFFEPGLEALVGQNQKAKRLFFSNNLAKCVADSEVILIAVGTPAQESGQADVSAVIAVAKQITKAIKSSPSSGKYKVIVNKSTVPVGMGDIVTKILHQNGLSDNKFAVVSNPEFLREGSAVADFMNPDRIVIGAANNRAFNVITELYRPLNAHIIFTTLKSAELIKYSSNAFLATKISFINEIANICERVGADVCEVAAAIGLDKRIGKQFLNAGIGYGGSCFPKDLSALVHLAGEHGYEAKILSSVMDINEFQIDTFIGKIVKALGKLENKKIAVLGLAFKPGTDDLREAPALKIIKRLRQKGAKINVFDPCPLIKQISGVKMCQDVYAAITNVEAMVLTTEWPQFQALDFVRIKKLLKKPFIFDGRNIYDPEKLKKLGFTYIGVGR